MVACTRGSLLFLVSQWLEIDRKIEAKFKVIPSTATPFRALSKPAYDPFTPLSNPMASSMPRNNLQTPSSNSTVKPIQYTPLKPSYAPLSPLLHNTPLRIQSSSMSTFAPGETFRFTTSTEQPPRESPIVALARSIGLDTRGGSLVERETDSAACQNLNVEFLGLCH